MITENVSTLKINKLTQAQYDREFAAGNIDENALYLTPDDTAETYMTKNNPTGTGSFSLNRKADTTIGTYSVAIGHNTTASETCSYAEGTGTKSTGEASHAEGYGTTASGNYSHAEGYGTVAEGSSSHAEGGGVGGSGRPKASGNYSHAEGYGGVLASGKGSHAEGGLSEASGEYSHAEGWHTTASGISSHAEGGNYTLNPDGELTSITANRTISAASYPIIGDTDITISSTTAQGAQSHAEGTQTFAFGYSSHAEGYKTNALGENSHAEGGYCGPYARASTASGDNSHAEGKGTLASGEASHAEGEGARASGNVSHAEGAGTEASGTQSHAEGSGTDAIGDYSHAEGRTTEASGEASHAEGYSTEAKGHYSHTEGLHTIAIGNNQHVQGKFNIGDTTNTYAHIVGNGSFETPSNAHTLDWNGNAWFAGNITVGANKKQVSTTDHTHSYLPLAGGTITGSLNAKFSNIDASHPKNGVSSPQYPTTFSILDKSNRILTRKEAIIGADGSIAAYWYVRNYDTSGKQVAQKGIKISMNKSGAISYSVDEGSKFLSAIGGAASGHTHDDRYVRSLGLNGCNINSTNGVWTVDISDSSHGSVPTPWVNVTQFSGGHFLVQIAIKCDNDKNASRAQGAVWIRNKYMSGAWSQWRQI